MRSHTKFGPDRFSRSDVYWTQTDKQTPRHPSKSIDIDYESTVTIFLYPLFLEFDINNLYPRTRLKLIKTVAEFKEFEWQFKFKPRFKSAKTRFKLSVGLNLQTFDTILSGTNHF